MLEEAEDTMNCKLNDGIVINWCRVIRHLMFSAVIMTARDGRVSRLEHVFLRGGQIKFIVIPDMLKNAPLFKKVQSMRAKAVDSNSSQKNKPGAKKAAK